MPWVTTVSAVCLVVLVGRNDGAPLASIAQHTSRGRGAWAPAVLTLCVPLVPFLGGVRVAQSLADTAAPSLDRPALAAATLLAVLATVGLSVAVSVPTSITLALVGALAGGTLAAGDGVDGPHVARVLALAAAAPVAACALAYALARVPLRVGPSGPAVLSGARKAAYGCLALAYSANDGQKITVVAALVLAVPVADAAGSVSVQLATAVLFGVGLVWGLRSSGRALRHGVAAPSPVLALWSQWATALVVGGGSMVGAPMSLTQSLAGSVLGSGLVRGRRAVRWNAAGRVVLAWLWTLPVAAALSALLVTALTHLPRPPL